MPERKPSDVAMLMVMLIQAFVTVGMAFLLGWIVSLFI